MLIEIQRLAGRRIDDFFDILLGEKMAGFVQPLAQIGCVFADFFLENALEFPRL